VQEALPAPELDAKDMTAVGDWVAAQPLRNTGATA
jgi:hypothetical protein